MRAPAWFRHASTADGPVPGGKRRRMRPMPRPEVVRGKRRLAVAAEDELLADQRFGVDDLHEREIIAPDSEATASRGIGATQGSSEHS